jgi:hypothetical protein
MSAVFDALPWYTRWWAHTKMAMPKWYQNWHGRRRFWNYATKGAKGGGHAATSLIRMMACAELNRRNGDDSLYEIIQKRLPGSQLDIKQWRLVKNMPPVTLRRYWVDNTANTTKRMPWE